MAKKSKAFGAKPKGKSTAHKSNPFDLKFQRQRRNVLGTKNGGDANNTPLGIRKTAFEIRKNTIGKELKLLNKQNKIKDQRIGQRNPNLNENEKAEMRFMAQRKSMTNIKQNKFLLNDDEEDNLEHLASSLTEAEKFQRGEGNEAYEDEDLDPELMAQASFGGGSLAQNKQGNNTQRLSRREIVQQAIERSVQAKAIKQRDRAIQFDQWEKLNQQFTELKEAGELSFGRAAMEKEEGDDDYMQLYTQLESDQRVPAKRDWAPDITCRAAKEQEVKESSSFDTQKESLFEEGNEKLAFPAAVERIIKQKIRNSFDLARALVVCHDAAVYLEKNRRYCPEIIGFLLNTLISASGSADDADMLLPTFLGSASQKLLFFAEKSSIDEIPPLSIASLKDADSLSLNEDRKLDLQLLRIIARLLRFFAELYDANTFEAFPIIFKPFVMQLNRLPVVNYPQVLADEIAETEKVVSNLIKKHSEMTHLHKSAAQKIKPLEMLEPRMESNFNARCPNQKRGDSQVEIKNLQKRMKREMRGTVKELRHDARFIADEQAKVRRQVDEERKKKTNRILASLQTQESEYKKRRKGKGGA